MKTDIPQNLRRKAKKMDESNKTSHLMLFCALLLVRKSRMELKDLKQLYPFSGDAERLAQEMAKSES